MVAALSPNSYTGISQSVSKPRVKHMGRRTVLQALSACENNMFGRSDATRLKAAAKY